MRFDIQSLRPSFPSQSHNIRTMRSSPLSEISGSLGDLGTLLPLLTVLAITNSISLASSLVFTGLANILTGLLFSIPLPVQPMKAIAAIAIAQKFSKDETAGAGLFVAAVIGTLSVSGLLDWVGRVVPVPVIKGIQVGAGLSLVLSAGSSLLQPLGWVKPSWMDNLFWALAAFVMLLVTMAVPSRGGLPRLPFALAVFLIGLALSITSLIHLSTNYSSLFHIWRPEVIHIPWPSFLRGALTAGLGQLPLTTLNSIIAVTHLCAELLPAIPAPSPSALGISVSLMNLAACPFGAMPTCHGSGGLAGQYRFGARSGASVVMLGAVKLILGLIVDERRLVKVLQSFPKALLGIMVIAAGAELAKVGEGLNVDARDLWERAVDGEDGGGDGQGASHKRELGKDERAERWSVMMVTVAGLLAFNNDVVGFLAGLACHFALNGHKWSNKRRSFPRMGLSRRWGFSLNRSDDEEREGLLER